VAGAASLVFLESLLAAKGDGTQLKFFSRLSKISAIIIDGFALTPLSSEQAKDVLEILEDRYALTSTIITSQLPMKQWHEVLGEPTIADAICDRLFHNTFKIEMRGESLRRRS